MILDIYKVDGYHPYVCAETVSITIEMETISTKTIGDGKWKRYRGQSLGFSLSGNGLIPYDDAVNVTAFDMMDRQLNMLHVPFRMVYRNDTGTVVKAQYGEGLITNLGFTGPNDFAGSSFSMLGSGPLIVFDGLTACDSAVVGLSLSSQTDTTITIAYTGASLAVRFDYRIYTTSGSFDILAYSGAHLAPAMPNGSFTVSPIFVNGNQRIEVTPVCANGENGTMISLNYTKT